MTLRQAKDAGVKKQKGLWRERCAVIHKMFLEPYNKQYRGVPRKEYDEAFQLGLELCELLEGMEYDLVS